jgi:hypothetical protein
MDLARHGLTWRQRLLKWKLDGVGRIRKLLTFHRVAFEAEIEGVWGRADFFWQEQRNELGSLWDRESLWEDVIAQVARQTGIACDCSAKEIRDRLLDEIFLDTHHAFYLGLERPALSRAPSDRAYVHVEAIDQLLDRSSRSQDEKVAIYGPLFMDRIYACREADQWGQAVKFATRLVSRLPSDREALELLIHTEHLRTLKSLRPGKSESTEIANASIIQLGIERQEALLRLHPSNVSLFDSLGVLHHLRAVKLANGDKVADALVEIERSLAFRPDEEEVEKARPQLVGMMQALQQQMRAVELSLASRPNTHLNAQGLALRDQARRGLEPARRFRESNEAKQILRSREVAEMRSLWQRVGLPLPQEGGDQSAFALARALERITANPPKKPAGIMAAWSHVVAADPLLAQLPLEPIDAFLRSNLFGEEKRKITSTFPSPAPLNVRSQERRPGGETLAEWTFSRQNPWIKAQAVIAVVLILVAGMMSLTEARNRQARNRAWTGLEKAFQRRDDLGVVKASEVFFATSPPSGGDPQREARARSLYGEALVHWFLRSPGEPDVEALRHVERYRSFLVSHPEEDQP